MRVSWGEVVFKAIFVAVFMTILMRLMNEPWGWTAFGAWALYHW